MTLRLRAFGIARDILAERNISFTLQDGETIGALKTALKAEYPAFAKLAALSFAVDETYQQDDYTLTDGTEVVIIPPVSGG